MYYKANSFFSVMEPNRRVASADFPGVAPARANRAIDAVFLR